MSKVRVHNLSVSLDGFATGADQRLEAPFGHAGIRLTEWFFPTATFQGMSSDGDRPRAGTTGVDDAVASRWGAGIGAEIMGANKFGPPGWQDDPEWRGWWGEDPPFHTPTFVLTHRPRPSIEMAGGTTFHFLDASLEEALAAAREAADGLDVRLGGGPSTVSAYLAAGLVDHLHVAVVPILLGRGVRLWDGLEGLEASYDVEAVTSPSGITHLMFDRKA